MGSAPIEFKQPCVMDFGFSLLVFINGDIFPLDTGVIEIKNVVEDFVVSNFWIWSTLFFGKLRKDKFIELIFSEPGWNDVVFS